MATTLAERVTARENVTVVVAILASLPLTYAFGTAFEYSSGAALLMLAVAVGLPVVYNERWPAADSTTETVARVLGSAVLAAVAFSLSYLVGTGLLSVSEAWTSGLSFVLTMGGLFGAARLLATRRESEETGRVESF